MEPQPCGADSYVDSDATLATSFPARRLRFSVDAENMNILHDAAAAGNTKVVEMIASQSGTVMVPFPARATAQAWLKEYLQQFAWYAPVPGSVRPIGARAHRLGEKILER